MAKSSKNDIALNERQILFCKEYIKCKFNGTEAAIRAGYSKKTAYSIASENLKKPEIQRFLSELIDKAAVKHGITKERVMDEIGRIAFSDLRMFYNPDGSLKALHELDDEAAAVLASVKSYDEKTLSISQDEKKNKVTITGTAKEIKLHDKTKALEMLAKHFRIYTDAPVLNNNLSFGYGPEKPV